MLRYLANHLGYTLQQNCYIVLYSGGLLSSLCTALNGSTEITQQPGTQSLSYSPEVVTGCVRGIRQNLEYDGGDILTDTIPKRNH